jgi:phosphoribosyl-ATP pyrophosphohydrolase/phosphoribosyl-AMP cyclohydrolase/histidinol dehydrogenase
MTPLLRPLSAADLGAQRHDPVDAATLAQAQAILDAVAAGGEAALRAEAHRLGDLPQLDAPLVHGPAALRAAWEGLDPAAQGVLARAAGRIRSFADAQRAALGPLELPVPGGRAGLRYAPVERAGCYAPGGRFPLPSSVLMTAVTARAAGVAEVWVASPRPGPVTLAAAHVAGADALLAVGGAQAIGAFAYGAGPVPAVDAIVGPGNRWVTAAKQRVAGRVAIDMLAGPSELLVLADGGADPGLIAADLLAQAEHDPDALPVLISLDPGLPARVDAALRAQLADLPTAEVARAALQNGGCVVLGDLGAACALCDRVAPEHLALHLADPAPAVARLRHHGALFVGALSAEALGDYGAGPNHVLPTGGTARRFGALSVMTFLRVQTWLALDDRAAAAGLVADCAALGRMEGLEAHARSADRRA